MFEVELPKIVEPKLEEIPSLPLAVIDVAFLAWAKKRGPAEPNGSAMIVQGLRRSVSGPEILRPHIIPTETAIKLLARQPLLGAKVLARHPEVFEPTADEPAAVAVVFVGQCGLVAFERLEL